MKTTKLTHLSILLSISIVLNIIEFMLPPIPIFLPGVVLRLGLANIITLFVLIIYGIKEGAFVHFSRIFLANLLSGRLLSVTFFNSLFGGILAFLIMSIAKKTKFFSPVGISVLGATFHIVGQITASILLYNIAEVFIFYLPILLLTSLPMGILTGLITHKFIKYTEEV